MIEHIMLDKLDLASIQLLEQHAQWLQDWLRNVTQSLEAGDVSSSLCLQGLVSELVLYRKTNYDWLGVFEDYLTDVDGNPLAYSQAYGERLFRFGNQWHQVAIHAIHTRWWVERFFNRISSTDNYYAELIEGYIQPNGWIYNPQVSPTQFRTRMKSEYMMSFAMGVEILDFHGLLAGYKTAFEATVSTEPLRPYLSAEYFRSMALEKLHALNFAPVGLAKVIQRCEAGAGYCDFSIADKIDDYMGTLKRVGRDLTVHSPLATLFAKHLASLCDDETQAEVAKRLNQFVLHLQNNPLDIPAFRIRDLTDIPFGTGISPLEVIAASALVNQHGTLRELN